MGEIIIPFPASWILNFLRSLLFPFMYFPPTMMMFACMQITQHMDYMRESARRRRTPQHDNEDDKRWSVETDTKSGGGGEEGGR